MGGFCHKDDSRVTAYELLLVPHKALRELGEEGDSYGTHSFRIGATTEASERGWGREAIMEMGRWALECYKSYVREESRREDGI